MRQALVKVKDKPAGIFTEFDPQNYQVEYFASYKGEPISLTMPTTQKIYTFNKFPPFFDGVLLEGEMLNGFLKTFKINKTDYFSQLLVVGEDLIGAVTVHEMP